MAGINTPFAQQQRAAEGQGGRQLSGLVLDDSFDGLLPTSPSLDK